MTENLLTENNETKIPEKFKNAQNGEVNIDALLKSYLELEKKLSTMVKIPSDDSDLEEINLFRKALGVPSNPEEYQIEAKHKLFASDKDVNQKLLDAGFTPKQAQLVYDLAVERVLPIIEELTAEYEADRQRQRLIEHFGGEDRFTEISRQISAWGEKNLPEEVYQNLATTFEGVVAINSMMEAKEPSINGRDNSQKGDFSEDELKTMMKDPRYWRDKEASYIAKISEGFKKLYS